MGNYLVYGEYPDSDDDHPTLFLPSGVIRGKNLAQVEALDAAKITESVTHSWYEYAGGNETALHPAKGETRPKYTGPKPPYERLDTGREIQLAQVSALRRRADGGRAAGADARRLRTGHTAVKSAVDHVLKKLGVGPEALFSTLGRIAARAIETRLLAEKMGDWVEELSGNMGKGDLRIHDNSKWDPSTWPKDARGAGFHEAPRGALGHWVEISAVPSATTSASSPAPGTRDRATLGASADLMSKQSSVHLWPIPSSLSKSSERSIRSIPAWPAASTCSIRRGASSPA